MENKQIPGIRFPGFIEKWDQRTIGEFGYFYYGRSAPKWSVTSDATTPCVRYGELYTKYKEKIEKVFSFTNISKEKLKFSTGNEVLIPRVGEDPLDFANCSWLSIPGVAIGEMISVYNTKQNPLFTAYMFNALYKHEFAKRVEGGNVSNLYYTYLEGISVSYPTTEEQDKIASFFDNLDSLITHHQKELDTLKQTKQGFLQKMFPKYGESVPEIRFPGFTGDWEQSKLKEQLVVHSGRDYKHLKSGDIPVYGTGGYMLSVNDSLSNENAIGIGRKGTIDKPQLLKAPFWTVDTLFYIIPEENSDLLFYYSLFNTIRWKKYDESTGVPSLSKSTINDIIVRIPEIEEQQKIGNFFKQLDDTIALHEIELETLKQTKKAFLQKMFV